MIVSVLFNILIFFLDLLPSFSVPAEIMGAFVEFASWVAVFNYYIPFNTFLTCLGIYFGVWVTCTIGRAVVELL